MKRIKEICKKCEYLNNERSNATGSKALSSIPNVVTVCMHDTVYIFTTGIKGSHTNLSDDAPEDCPYKMEHIIMEQLKPKRKTSVCESCLYFTRMFDMSNEENGMVNCKLEGRDRQWRNFLGLFPPEDCPYKLEHIVMK